MPLDALVELGDATLTAWLPGVPATGRYFVQVRTPAGLSALGPAFAVTGTSVLPQATTTVSLGLDPGLNLICLPIAACTGGNPMTEAWLTQTARSGFIATARPEPSGQGLLTADLDGFAGMADPLAGGRGYLLNLGRPASFRVELSGTEWPDTSRVVSLSRGLNLVGYAGQQVPASLTSASGLAARAPHARFLVRLQTFPGSAPRFQVYLPGAHRLSEPFAIEAGKGYILDNDRAEELDLRGP
jgi:hypothetical protein